MNSGRSSNKYMLIIGVIVPCIAHIFIGIVSSESSYLSWTNFDLDDPEILETLESLDRFERKIIPANDTASQNLTVKELNPEYFAAKAAFLANNGTKPAAGGNGTANANGTEPEPGGNSTAPAGGDGTAPAPDGTAPAPDGTAPAPAPDAAAPAPDAAAPAPPAEPAPAPPPDAPAPDAAAPPADPPPA